MDTAPTALDTSTAENNRFACVAAAWAAHEGELRSFLRRRLRDAAAADDLLQDVFVKAMRQGQGFCTLDQPRAWLFEVARHAAIDRERTRRDAEPIEDHAERLAAADPDAPPPVDALTNCLTRVIDELAPEDAQIVRACDIGGQTVRAYAESRGVGLAAAKSRLLRARQRLRDRLTQVCRVRFDPHDGSVCGHDGRASSPPRQTMTDQPPPSADNLSRSAAPGRQMPG